MAENLMTATKHALVQALLAKATVLIQLKMKPLVRKSSVFVVQLWSSYHLHDACTRYEGTITTLGSHFMICAVLGWSFYHVLYILSRYVL